ncbi:CRISPR-associated protein Cas5 [Pseudomonas lactis]|nr:CRISPR-associated protein Cas5 [Pseudomonas fluorescens]NNA50182.1 CRISPR-associated protein Cas5 [Pseudomonas lactis]
MLRLRPYRLWRNPARGGHRVSYR